MERKLSSLWAKKNRNASGMCEWLPLSVHLNDTMEVCRLVWEHWLSDGVKEFMINSIKTNGEVSNFDDREKPARSLCKFLGAVHDIGKATPYFQLKRSFRRDEELDGQILENLKSAGFKELDKFYTATDLKESHQSMGQFMLAKRGVNMTVADIVGAHHGRPMSMTKGMDISNTNFFYQVSDKNSEIYKTWMDIHDELFNRALEAAGYESVDEIPLISQPAQVLFSALLIMADWITSNEKYFPLIDIASFDISNTRVEDGYIKWRNDRTEIWSPDFVDVNKIYEERFKLGGGAKFVPRDAQRKITEVIEKTNEPGIVIFEAPMGMGKTEAALVAVEQLAKKTGRTGMFFGLPTQATSNGIFSRVSAWLENLTDDVSRERSVRLIHGKAALNKEFSDLPKSRNIHEEETNDKNTVSVNDWFSGRKLSMLDDFTVGTIDQFLLVALKQKHLMLRHLGFANKVVVIDEVHAYDAYMGVYLYQAIKWMGAYGVPVVVLSATLPIEKRNELVKNYLEGKDIFLEDGEATLPEKFYYNEAYPLLTITDGEKVIQFEDFEREAGTDFEVSKLSKAESEDIAELIKSITDEGVVGVIVNTVRKAQEYARICSEVFGDENVFLLHSSFIATDRYKKEEELLRTIGKNGDRPKFKIVIGTQVIEQSLDIDFDVLITELAPMDLILQRMGREHRHKNNKRPTHLETPKVYVLNSTEYDFDKGSTYVYDEYMLFRTEYFLPEKINLPNDISHLVQLVYSEKELTLDNNLVEIYNEYKRKYKTKKANKESSAEDYRIDCPIAPDFSEEDLIVKWIENPNSDAELSEVKASAQVRDSDESIEVIALKKCEGGYEFFDEKGLLDINDNKTAMKMAQHTLRLPRQVFYNEGIDKIINLLEDYYKENFSDWDSQSWLKNNLGIIFDENGEFKIFDKILKYDKKYGLIVEKEGDDGRI